MSRAMLGALAALAVLGAVPGEARAPARLMVLADEHSLVLSRQSILRGPAVIQLVNRGEDPHDLKLQRRGSAHVSSVPETPAGELREARLRLHAGRYRLWCSLPGHRALGMRAQLRVRRGALRAASRPGLQQTSRKRWKATVSGIPFVDSIDGQSPTPPFRVGSVRSRFEWRDSRGPRGASRLSRQKNHISARADIPRFPWPKGPPQGGPFPLQPVAPRQES
jgi:hypothetical protein